MSKESESSNLETQHLTPRLILESPGDTSTPREKTDSGNIRQESYFIEDRVENLSIDSEVGFNSSFTASDYSEHPSPVSFEINRDNSLESISLELRREYELLNLSQEKEHNQPIKDLDYTLLPSQQRQYWKRTGVGQDSDSEEDIEGNLNTTRDSSVYYSEVAESNYDSAPEEPETDISEEEDDTTVVTSITLATMADEELRKLKEKMEERKEQMHRLASELEKAAAVEQKQLRQELKIQYLQELERSLKEQREQLAPNTEHMELMSKALADINKNTARPTAKMASLDSFSGASQDVSLWLQRLENYFTIHNVEDGQQKIQIAISYLKGQAYHSLSKYAGTRDWATFRKALLDHFLSDNQKFMHRQVLDNLRMKKTTDVEKYIEDKLSLSAKADLSEKETCRSLLSGLHLALKANVLSQKPAMNLPEVLSAIRLAATTENMRKEAENGKSILFLAQTEQEEEEETDPKYLHLKAALKTIFAELKAIREEISATAARGFDNSPSEKGYIYSEPEEYHSRSQMRDYVGDTDVCMLEDYEGQRES